ncbi:DUF3072 domain-containing protein [Piscinibacter koreensis]|uniref:DUF3072 domain-containing protein n=1 Tax=Piscinibacter koreensis TaxID=2742824 RepID=UPI001C37C9C2|nr:DUF3072 domain-containing protein [Schlegelella koreensis]
MTDKRTQAESGQSNTEKDPDDWVTGDEPMTGAQRSYLTTLAQEAKVEVDTNLTKAEASRRIDELQQMTGRGTSASQGGGDSQRGHASNGASSGSANERGGTGDASGAGGGGSKSSDTGNAPPGGGAGDDAGAMTDELDFDGNGSRERS